MHLGSSADCHPFVHITGSFPLPLAVAAGARSPPRRGHHKGLDWMAVVTDDAPQASDWVMDPKATGQVQVKVTGWTVALPCCPGGIL